MKKDTLNAHNKLLEDQYSLSVQKSAIEKYLKKTASSQENAKFKLIATTIIAVIFMTVEVIGGKISNSTSIYSDAAHMFSDFSGFGISLISIIMSQQKPTDKISFGYHRFEILGALFSILSIILLSFGLAYFAIWRLINESYEVEEGLMLIIAVVGLISNIIMGKILHSGGGHHHGCSHGHSHSNEEESHEGHDHSEVACLTQEEHNRQSMDTLKSEILITVEENKLEEDQANEEDIVVVDHEENHNHQEDHIHEEKAVKEYEDTLVNAKQTESKDGHVHSSNCNHKQEESNKEHKHSSNCNHKHEIKHKNKVSQEHKHGSNCNHKHEKEHKEHKHEHNHEEGKLHKHVHFANSETNNDHEHNHDKHEHNHEHKHEHEHNHDHKHEHEHKHDHKHEHEHKHDHKHGKKNKHQHKHGQKHEHKHGGGCNHKHDHNSATNKVGHDHDHDHNEEEEGSLLSREFKRTCCHAACFG